MCYCIITENIPNVISSIGLAFDIIGVSGLYYYINKEPKEIEKIEGDYNSDFNSDFAIELTPDILREEINPLEV